MGRLISSTSLISGWGKTLLTILRVVDLTKQQLDTFFDAPTSRSTATEENLGNRSSDIPIGVPSTMMFLSLSMVSLKLPRSYKNSMMKVKSTMYAIKGWINNNLNNKYK